jgi:glutamine amidotransferase
VIALIDYGAGNLTSVRKGLAAVQADVFTPAAAADLERAAAIVIPGVGHFGATRALDAAWRESILAAVSRKVPVLGICLGMQYLFEGSDEATDAPGLGLLDGRCRVLPPVVKVPHVGWNALSTRQRSKLLAGIADATSVYFTHSYAPPITRAAVATTEHGVRFASVVEQGCLYGVQFHPEKSGDAGLRILRSFVEISTFPNSQISRC